MLAGGRKGDCRSAGWWRLEGRCGQEAGVYGARGVVDLPVLYLPAWRPRCRLPGWLAASEEQGFTLKAEALGGVGSLFSA